MILPSDCRTTIDTVFDSSPIRSHELSGGQIGTVYQVTLGDGQHIVAKVGETPLDIEGQMLEHLAAQTELPVPTVYHAESNVLLIEYIDGNTTHDRATARDTADRLAALHDHRRQAFGFEWDTLTGPIRQPNPWTDSWIEFYRDHRLAHLLSTGNFSAEIRERIETLCTDLDELLCEPEHPSLIHGDVWTTNILAHEGRVEAFLDPAIYYADPEIELAYIDWTDTFGSAFFDRYREQRRIESGFFEHRRFIYRLYPLLVHVHLFGGRYRDALHRTLNRIGY